MLLPLPIMHPPHLTMHPPSYHAPAPSHHAPAPAYDPPAPKPEIVILPAPDLSHHAPPAPSYVVPVETPGYGSPSAPAYEAPVEAPETYGSPAAPVEAPDTYGSPEAPAYEAPVAPVDPPVYVPEEPPVYQPATYDPAPVDIVPAVNTVPDNIAPLARVVPEGSGSPEPLTEVPASVVVLRDGEEELRSPKAFNGDQAQNNQLQFEQTKPTLFVSNSLEDPAENIIIDLTNNEEVLVTVEDEAPIPAGAPVEQPAIPPPFEQLAVPLEISASSEVQQNTAPVLQQLVVEPSAAEPIIQEPEQIAQPVSEEPVQVIVFEPVQLAEEAARKTPFFIISEDDETPSTTEGNVVFSTETIVTPIVQNQELKTIVQSQTSPPEVSLNLAETASPEVTESSAVEVFDLLSDDGQVAELVIAEVVDSSIEQESNLVQQIEEDLVEELGKDTVEKLEEEIVAEIDEELVKEVEEELIEEVVEELAEDVKQELVKEVELENEILDEARDILNEIVVAQEETTTIESKEVKEVITTTRAPILRKVTFKIQGDDPTEESLQENVEFELVTSDEGVQPDTFNLVEPTVQAELEEEGPATGTIIPEALSEDPAFQEIVNDSAPLDQRKRAYLPAYDPRASRVYGHKYNDDTSNWYYYSRAGY